MIHVNCQDENMTTLILFSVSRGLFIISLITLIPGLVI